jgi:divalent metal cation (Fe/Co/Zn/Cd) transporter
MFLVGQWIIFTVAVLLGLMLLWHAARYILKLILVLFVAAVIVYGLHYFSMLPQPAQQYIDELFSPKNVQAVKDWVHQWTSGGQEEKTAQNEANASS